ncbi:MAG: beta-N-acetylhexosaminidase [Chitinophagaceae bacterium]|nr:beta-N-acetylhexosaminidase [Chitinophagaceae bacterium]
MKQYIFLVSLLLNAYIGYTQQVIPFAKPQATTQTFSWKDINSISFSNPALKNEVDVFNAFMKRAGLSALPVVGDEANSIRLELSAGNESYAMEKSGTRLIVRGDESGIFYGLMTLLQQRCSGDDVIVLSDAQPAFPWRGMHLDVSRHFFPVSFVKKYIDILALHKMNTFHWHLTDDQGWRIEIKKYPKLTEIGSQRKETMVDKHFNPYVGDGKPVKGYYTQQEVKEVVQYAADRHITVVPEIEMPGHSLGALSAYPQYSCNAKPLEVLTIWGVSDDVLCTKDSTFLFLQDILDEVMALFPSQYIHIGGDEVPKTRWKKCAVCQGNIKKHHLKDEHELQSYFIRKIDAYVNSKGRSIIGWDEILEGGLAPNAAVMSWRGEAGGIEAARQKHKVVMTPGTHCYFDHYQGHAQSEPLAIGGYTTVEKVYSYNPIPDSLTAEQQGYIMGAQGNVWTEYMGSSDHVEYMAVTRLCALSEVLWCGTKKPGYSDFVQRLKKHFEFLDRMKIHYAPSIYDVQMTHTVSPSKVNVALTSTYQDGLIYYSFNDPHILVAGEKFVMPFDIEQSGILRAQYFEGDDAPGHVFEQAFEIHQALGAKITVDIPASKYYNSGGLDKLLDAICGQSPRKNAEWLGWSGQSPTFNIDLGRMTAVKEVRVDCLSEIASWIYLPEGIEVWGSVDGKTYTSMGQKSAAELKTDIEDGMDAGIVIDPQSVRYLKVKVNCAGKIAKGNPGEGEDAWLFVSEVMVY